MKTLKITNFYIPVLVFFLTLLGQVTLAQNFIFNEDISPEKEDSKLKYGLQGLVKTYESSKVQGTFPSNTSDITFDNNVYFIKQDSILIDAIAENEGTNLVEELKAKKIKITAHYGKIVTCWVSFEQLFVFETLKTCRWIQPTLKPIRNSGVVQTQGDLAQRSDLARNATGLNGSGVKVGVLSDSYNNLNGATSGINAGELPGTGNPNGLTTPVTVLQDLASGGSDEGRAMLEIIHDVAPNAQLYFNTAFGGKASFANGITALANNGCKVIIDDILNLSEAMFQDDIVAQAVNNVKNNQEVTYLSAAGNSTNKSYENSFQPSGVNYNINSVLQEAHNFGTSTNQVLLLPITIPQGGNISFALQWNQPYFSISGGSGATTDLNFFLLNNSNSIVAGNITNEVGLDAVTTIINYTNSTSNTVFYLLITKRIGASPSKIKFIAYSGNSSLMNGLFSNSGSITGLLSSTSSGHANADGAIAVGASNFNQTPAFGINPPQIASYSSYGGVPILFNQSGVAITPIIRNKPEVVAPAGGNTSFFGSDSNIDTDTYPNFFGTSAAAPHAGAVAALMLQAKPTATPNDIKAALIGSCVDMGTAGFDFITGNGLIRADNAVLSFYSITANTPTNTVLCQGGSFSFSFASVGTFGSGNIYNVQLSNSSGSFTSPTIIGSFTSTTNSGTITGIIPINTLVGSGYRIRIVPTKPAKASNEIAISIISVLSQPLAFTTSSATVCQGNNNVIYTIPVVAGATNYTWNYSGTGATFSSTSNSVTVNFSATATAGDISVVANNACGSSPARTLAIIVNSTPTQPLAFTTSSATVCQGNNNVIYTIPIVAGATNYTWTYSGTGATFTSTSNSVTVSFSTTATAGILSVTANNTCGNSPARTLAITVNSTPTQPLAFTTLSATVCQGNNNVIYAIPVVAGATNYTWTYSGTGATFTSTSNSVTVNFSASATAGTLSVTANNACGSSPARTLAIIVNSTPTTPTTSQSGDWNVISNWQCGFIPTSVTDAIISFGNVMTINGVMVEAKKLINNGGTVQFLNSSILKLNN